MKSLIKQIEQNKRECIAAQGFRHPLTSAFGEEMKVTEGIVSAKCGFRGLISQYQFSAAVQPGNSGRPLFNDNGELIGIINAKRK